jgi:hypothetical protein
MKDGPIIRRLAEASVDISNQDEPDSLDFIHSVLAQVGMPRRAIEERFFERASGRAMMRLEAGTLYSRGKFVQQPLPYGTKPRLVMVHISGEAVRTKRPVVEVGNSVREFLIRLGIDTSGGAHGGYTMFKKQMEALAACRLVLGYSEEDRDITINTQPIRRFEAWLPHQENQTGMWPGVMELSQDFFESLQEHAVPLDHTALGALKHSSMALDIYTWLAHRLCRERKRQGTKVSWYALKEQFGQEYKDVKAFKREFLQALRQVIVVYPDAQVYQLDGGLLLKPSRAPVARKLITS